MNILKKNGNTSKNGYYKKTVGSDAGKLELDIQRTFSSQNLNKPFGTADNSGLLAVL